jgi:hypothetical protein
LFFSANKKKEFKILGLLYRSLNDYQPVQIHILTLVVALKLSYGRMISFQFRHMSTRTVKTPGLELSLLPIKRNNLMMYAFFIEAGMIVN